MKICIGAYACGPGDEPEAGAGWAFATAAAADNDVWVITRRRFQTAIEAALDDDPRLRPHLRVVFLDRSPRVLALKRGPGSVYWYYASWQRLLAREAARLHDRVGFDVAHHVTFAADWLPCGLARLDVPLVWGPVGGATYQPWSLMGRLGARGVVTELTRSSFTRLARRVWADPVARRAAIVVGQNPDTTRRFSSSRRGVVEPNAAFGVLPAPDRADTGDGPRRAVFIGRLIPWKGCQLALAALARPPAAEWVLDVYGTGRDRESLEAQADRLGLAGRVRFLGQRPRTEILRALSQADAMIFPSMHDSAGWAVGEASATGCPVVCLDHGGPPVLAGPNGHLVGLGGDVVAGLADALAATTRRSHEPYRRWSKDRLPALLAEWYADAAATAPG